MKARRLKIKYFAALAVLMASLLAVGGATYAWFAMNRTADASGMQVRVKAEGTYLLIAHGHLGVDDIQALQRSSADAQSSAALYPAAHEDVAYTAEADTAAKWYFRQSYDPGSFGGVGNETGKTYLTDAVSNQYVLVNEFGITVADSANPVRNLKVSNCAIGTAGDQAVKVLITSPSAAVEFSGAGGSNDTVLSAAGVTDTTAVYFKVYIYWDGTDSNVYTNNIDQLKNTTVEIEFAGEIVESP